MRHELSVLKIRYPKPKFKKLTLFGEMNFFKYGILKLFSSNLVTPFLVKVKKLVDLFILYNSEVKRNFDYGLKFTDENIMSSEFGYTGDFFFNEISFMKKYKDQIDEKKFAASESEFVYKEVLENSSDLISVNNKSFYLNFGIGYAYTDAILAERFKSSLFIGVERTSAAEVFNVNYLRESPKNLVYLKGEITDLKNEITMNPDWDYNDFAAKIFITARTMCLLPEYKVREIYRFANDLKFDYIIGVEQFGIPRGNMIPFPFSYEENLKSQHWRSIIAVHNYPGILLASGYELVKLKVVKTNNPHPDFRLMSFIAKRVS